MRVSLVNITTGTLSSHIAFLFSASEKHTDKQQKSIIEADILKTKTQNPAKKKN